MRRSLALAVGLLSVLGRCAPAYAQVAPLTSSVSSLTASSGGSGSGDIDSVAITTSSPLTGTASCTTGACSFTLGLGTVTVAKGGTGLTAGTDGGILGYTATGTLASSIALTLHALLVGGGAGATPTPLGSLGTSTQVLHGAAAGDPTWGAIVNADITNATIDLTTKVTGALPVANGGSGLATTTAYSPVFSGTTATGTWSATTGPGTSGQVLTSNGAGAYPTWQAAGGGISGLTAGRVPYAASATTLTDSSTFTYSPTTGLTIVGDDYTRGLNFSNGAGIHGSGSANVLSLLGDYTYFGTVASATWATWQMGTLFDIGNPIKVTATSAGQVVSTIKGAASQTANLTEWQNSSSTVLASVSAAGRMGFAIGTASDSTLSLVSGGTRYGGYGLNWHDGGGGANVGGFTTTIANTYYTVLADQSSSNTGNMKFGSGVQATWSAAANPTTTGGDEDTGIKRLAAAFVGATDGNAAAGSFGASAYYLGTATSAIKWTSGSGSPESAVTAPVGSLYSRTDGGAATSLYVKESGSGNTGWVAK